MRGVLDAAGLRGRQDRRPRGDLDEFSIADLLDAGAPIDSFGVGTSLGVGAGSVERDIEGGALGGVYKEVFYVDERGPHPKVKVAGEKSTWPGIKEVYRIGSFEEDVIQLADEPKPRARRAPAQAGRAGRRGGARLAAAAERDLGARPGQPAPPARAVPPAGRRARPIPSASAIGHARPCASARWSKPKQWRPSGD